MINFSVNNREIDRSDVFSDVKLLVFDLGGVLIELTGIPVIMNWLNEPVSEDEIWKKWLRSPSVRNFESGRTSISEFAAGVIDELELPVGNEEFLEQFARWPLGYYEGADEFLLDLREHYSLACLTNTNPIHWNKALSQWNVEKYFHSCFASHIMGCVKPDRIIFETLLRSVPFDASEIIFFDDNILNVETAVLCGIRSFHVKGFDQLKRAVESLYV